MVNPNFLERSQREVRRMPLLRTPLNKGKKEGPAYALILGNPGYCYYLLRDGPVPGKNEPE
jgi:hypothetical protein